MDIVLMAHIHSKLFQFENLNLIKNCYTKQHYKQSYNVENTMKYLFFISATLFTDYFIVFDLFKKGGRLVTQFTAPS